MPIIRAIFDDELTINIPDHDLMNRILKIYCAGNGDASETENLYVWLYEVMYKCVQIVERDL